jgi:hypothetical protein
LIPQTGLERKGRHGAEGQDEPVPPSAWPVELTL